MSVNFRKLRVLLVLIPLVLFLLSCIKTPPVTSPSPVPTPAEATPVATTQPATSSPSVVTPSVPSPTPLTTRTPAVTPVPVTPSALPALTPPPPTPLPSPSLPPVSSVLVPNLEVIASGLEVPWALAFAPDGRLFFTERPGRVRVMEQGKLLDEPVARLDVAAVSEGGLLGLALDPDFRANGYLYVYYTYRSAGTLRNKVERLTIKDNKAMESKVLIEGIPGNAIHDGGRLKFGPDDKLYITTGDAGDARLSQNLQSLAGKILRLNQDGTIPQDNPFPGSAVYSWGNRNPEGLAWQPGTGLLFSTEHSSSAHDELNIIKPGTNYGWPTITGKQTAPELVSPLIESGSDTWAPAGMTFYQGAVFQQWEGNLFFGTLRGEHLHRVVLSGQEVASEEKLFQGELGRIRDVLEGPDGFLYFTTSNRDGRGSIRLGDDHIYRLAPK